MLQVRHPLVYHIDRHVIGLSLVEHEPLQHCNDRTKVGPLGVCAGGRRLWRCDLDGIPSAREVQDHGEGMAAWATVPLVARRDVRLDGLLRGQWRVNAS